MRNIIHNLRRFAHDGERMRKDESGLYLAFTALSCIALFLMVASVYNIGVVVAEKMNVQNTADAAAYSQAVWEARTLNLLAYTNRAIIMHMVTIAFATAVFSQELLWKEIYVTAQVAAGVASLAPPVAAVFQAIATTARLIWRFWKFLKPLAKQARDAADYWVQGALLFQTGIVAEYNTYGLFSRTSVPKRVSKGIDGKVLINDPGIVLGGVALDAANAASFFTKIKQQTMNKKSFYDTYKNSMDGFSKGTSFPRKAAIPPFSKFAQWEFGLRGDVTMSSKRVQQTDGFGMKAIYLPKPPKLWPEWWFDIFIPVAPQSYKFRHFKTPLKMWNVKKKDGAPPSVLAYARKKSADVPQINVLSIGLPAGKDIDAFANAEVFYSDPDRNRGQKTGANLFNPFWHARLAPVTNALSFLPGPLRSIAGVLPVAH